MSHYVAVKTVFKDQAALVQALEDVFGQGKVEISTDGAALFGYQGDNRSLLPASNGHYAPPCHVIVRQQNTGVGASNDLGWCRQADGTFRSYISAYDNGALRNSLPQLAQRYARAVAVKQAKLSGYTVTEEKAKDGTIKLSLSKWGG